MSESVSTDFSEGGHWGMASRDCRGGGGKKMKVFCDLMEQHSKVLNEGRK